MGKFDFKSVIKENLYNSRYSGDDKIRIVLNEGRTVLIEREIHEGLMDTIRGVLKDPEKLPKGWMGELGQQLDIYLKNNTDLNDSDRIETRNYYLRNLSKLGDPDHEYKTSSFDLVNTSGFYDDIQNSLEDLEDGDIDGARKELEDVPGFGDEDSGVADDFFKDDSKKVKRRSVLGYTNQGIANLANDLKTGDMSSRTKNFLQNQVLQQGRPADMGVNNIFNLIKKVVSSPNFKNRMREQNLRESKNQRKILESVVTKCIKIYIKNENKKQLKS